MPYETYFELSISFDTTGDGFAARAVMPDGSASAPTQFYAPIAAADLAKLDDRMTRATQKRGPATAAPSAPTDGKFAQDVGDALFAAVFRDDVLRAFERSLELAHRNRAGLRLRLQLGDTPGLIKYPWEFMYRRDTHDFLAMSSEIAIVRDVGLRAATAPAMLGEPLEILIVAADPSQDEELQIRREVDGLRESVADLERRGKANLTLLAPSEHESTWDALRRELIRRAATPYHILHFIGHGEFDEREGLGVLLFENDRRREHRVTGEDLGTLLRNHGFGLVVINSCSAAVTTDVETFSGVAQALLRKGIPAVIGMQYEITDKAAIKFATAFYQGIADGLPFDEAMTQARLAILGFGNRLEWATPVLYMRSAVASAPRAPLPILPPSPPRPTPIRDVAPTIERDPLGPEPLPTPWYRTKRGAVVGGLGVAILVGAAVVARPGHAPDRAVSPAPSVAPSSAIALSTNAPAAAPAYVAAYATCPMPGAWAKDDFRSPSFAWKPVAYAKFGDGALTIAPPVGFNGRAYRNSTVNDATVCATVENGLRDYAGDAQSVAGIAYWWTGSKKGDDYDIFTVSLNGGFLVDRTSAATLKWTTVLDGRSTAIDRRVGSTNVLAVRLRGTGAWYYINGTLVGHAVGSPKRNAYVGLSGSSFKNGGKVVPWRFDNFGIGSP